MAVSEEMRTLGVLAVYMDGPNGNKFEELDFYRKLSVYGAKMGLRVALFTPNDVDDEKQSFKALHYDDTTGKWERLWIPFPQLIYDRCRYHGGATFKMLSAFRKSHAKLRYMAKPLANKWSMHQVMLRHEQIAGHLPDTRRYSGSSALSKLLDRHRFVYLKPKSGTGGRGIIRVERLAGDAFALQGRNASRDILPARTVGADALGSSMRSWGADNRYIMQQGIPPLLTDGRVSDFRLLIQKNGSGAWEVTGCAGRIGPSSSITSNLHGGGLAISMNALLRKRFESKSIQSIKSSMYDLCLIVAQHLERHYGRLCELGIDLAVDPDGYVWLLEVNPKPSREVFRRIGEEKTYRKAIVRPLEYAKWLLERKSAPLVSDTEKPAQQ